MKKVLKVNLHNLSQAEMAKKEQGQLKGGYNLPCVCVVGCSCKYAGEKEGPNDSHYGGSSRTASGDANGGRYQASGHD